MALAPSSRSSRTNTIAPTPARQPIGCQRSGSLYPPYKGFAYLLVHAPNAVFFLDGKSHYKC